VLGYSPLEGCGIRVQEQDGGADKSLAHVGRRVVRRMPGAVGFITRFKRLKSNYYMRLGRARGLQLILREKCCTDYSQREHRRPVSTGSCSFFLVTRILSFSLRCSWHSALSVTPTGTPIYNCFLVALGLDGIWHFPFFWKQQHLGIFPSMPKPVLGCRFLCEIAKKSIV
jgi:hypothetical protein